MSFCIFPVHADDECGLPTSGVVTCNSSTYVDSGDGTIRYKNQNGIHLESNSLNLVVDPVQKKQAIRIDTGRNSGFTGDMSLSFNLGTIVVGDSGNIGSSSSVTPGRYGDGLRIENRGQGLTSLLFSNAEVRAYGYNAHGIYAWQRTNNPANSSMVTISVSGDNSYIETHGKFSSAVFGRTDTGHGDISISASDGKIVSTGVSSAGVRAYNDAGATGAAGNISINVEDLTISTLGRTSQGVKSENNSDGTSSIQVSGSSISTEGDDAEGLFTYASGDSTVQVTDSFILTSGLNSAAVATQVDDGSTLSIVSGSALAIFDGSNIQTTGDESYGILALSTGSGTAMIAQNSGKVITSGDSSHGIYAFASYGLSDTNTLTDVVQSEGSVRTTGLGAHGVLALSVTGEARATQAADGLITATGLGSNGISVGATDGVTVTVAGHVSGGRDSGTGSPGSGIHAFSGLPSETLGDTSFMPNMNAVNLTIDSTGSIDALSDQAVLVSGGMATLDNDGTIAGYVTLWEGDDNFINRSENSWNIRNFAATTMPSIRDTENVALSDFGAGTDTFTNTASGVVRLMTVEDQTGFTTDTTDDNQPTAWLTSGVTEYFPSTALPEQPSVMLSITETGVEQAHLVNLERFENAGLLTMADAETGGAGPIAGDVFAITANATVNGTSGGGVYVSNGGRLHIDTVLNNGAVDETDLLVVDRAILGSGATQVVVTNARPGNAASTDLNGNGKADVGEGILVIQSLENGSDAGAFVLANPLEEGAFVYDLDQTDGQNWYLQTVGLSSLARVYEAIPHILTTKLPTMKQRFSQNLWDNTQLFINDAPQARSWVRLTGDFSKIGLNSGTSFDSDEWKFQANLDLPLESQGTGQWVLGLTAQASSIDASVSGSHGGGSVDSDSVGIGATATWYNRQGTYIDIQSQLNWFDSSFMSAIGGDLSNSEISQSYALSTEVGHWFPISETMGLTPQAQLTWARLNGAEFTDKLGNEIDLRSNDRVVGRIGLAYDHQFKSDANSHKKLYVIGNVLHNFSDLNKVSVGGVILKSEPDSSWIELGMGGSIEWGKGKSIYSEASYRTLLNSPSSNNRNVVFNVGFRWEW